MLCFVTFSLLLDMLYWVKGTAVTRLRSCCGEVFGKEKCSTALWLGHSPLVSLFLDCELLNCFLGFFFLLGGKRCLTRTGIEYFPFLMFDKLWLPVFACLSPVLEAATYPIFSLSYGSWKSSWYFTLLSFLLVRSLLPTFLNGKKTLEVFICFFYFLFWTDKILVICIHEESCSVLYNVFGFSVSNPGALEKNGEVFLPLQFSTVACVEFMIYSVNA